MAVAGIGPHTIVKGKDTAASAGEPAQQGLDSDTSLVLLKHIPQGKEQLDRIWDAVTDPRHKEYRNFRTANDVLAMVAPAASDVDGVVQWLAARGYSTVQRHGDALTVSKKKEGAKADPDQASSVTNQVDDENRTPTTSGGAATHLWTTVSPPPGVPSWHPLIEFVVNANAPRAVHERANHRWRRSNAGHSPPGIPATTLRDLYSVPANSSAGAGGRGAGIAVSNWQGSDCLLYPPDVESYCSMSSFDHYRQGRHAHSQPCRLELRSRAAPNASAACIEADLDSEILFAAADMTRSVVGANNGTSFLPWAVAWFGQKHGPDIATVSWSGSEVASLPSNTSVEFRLNTELQKLGVIGKAIFWASGDVGTGAPKLPPNSTDGVYRCTAGEPFTPSFPATSPYVTSCGGTELHNVSSITGDGGGRRQRRERQHQQQHQQQHQERHRRGSNTIHHKNARRGGSGCGVGGAGGVNGSSGKGGRELHGPTTASPLPKPPPICNKVRSGCAAATGAIERATSLRVSGFSSGGGFSWWFPQPSWQVPHVAGYLRRASATLPPAALWSRRGRGVPDVSSAAGSLVLVTNGAVWLGGGTSAAAPWWGGVWALATAMAKAKTGRPLGPATPLLYHLAQTTTCFHDIVEGDNKCPWGPQWEGQMCNCSTCYGFETAVGWDPVTGLGSPNVSCILNEISQLLS